MIDRDAMRGLRAARAGRLVVAGVCVLSLAGCVAHMAPLRADHVVVVSGKLTAGDAQPDAVRQALFQAAKLTVDHGYRYFRVLADDTGDGGLSAIRPGVNVAVKLYAEGEIAPHSPGVWDADEILTKGLPSATASTNPSAPRRANTPAAPGQPHCTAYGCVW